MSLSINETEQELVLTFPKSSDLDIKAYNPDFLGSLGLNDVSVSVIGNPHSPQQMGGAAQPHTLSFPYNQFVFLLKGERPQTPVEPAEPEKTTEPTKPAEPAEELHKTAKPYSYFSGVLDKIFQMFFAKKQETEPVPPVEEPVQPVPSSEEVAQPVPPVGQESSLLPTPSISTDELTKTTPTTVKDENVLFQQLSPQQVQQEMPKEPTLPPPPPAQQPFIQNIYITQPSGQQTVISSVPKEVDGEKIQEMPKMEEIPKSPQLPQNEMPKEPIAEPPQPTISSITQDVSGSVAIPVSVSLPLSKEVVGENIQEMPKMEEIPKSPQLPQNEMPKEPIAEPPQPIPSVETQAFWKISIPKGSNPPKVFEETEIGEKYEQHFRDIYHQHKMETKSGIYISGKFYTILGRKMKIGAVEQSSPEKNTLKDYLLSTPPLEGTIMDKYRKLYIE